MDSRLLSGMDEAQRRALQQRMARHRYRKSETVFHAGDPGDTLHVISKGHAAVRVGTPLGEIATLTVLGPGDFFGEQALISTKSTRTASVVALDALETQTLDRRAFNELRLQDARVDRMLVTLFSAQIQRLTDNLLEALYCSADTRVLRRLSDLALLYGDGARTEIPLTQEDLSTMAGTTRPTANRVLRELADAGVVELSRGRIVVTNRAALTRRAR